MAQVLVSKHADHLPLYRQAQIYKPQGVELDRSTLADWVGPAAWHLCPVHHRLLEVFKSWTKLFADETMPPVLDPGRGRTKTGQLWAYARDDRPWQGSGLPFVAYIYAPDRKATRPIAHLDGFTRISQVDGYGGYRPLAEKHGWPWLFAGRLSEDDFMNSQLVVLSPLPAKRYGGSSSCTALRLRSVVKHRKSVLSFADRRPIVSYMLSGPGCKNSF